MRIAIDRNFNVWVEVKINDPNLPNTLVWVKLTDYQKGYGGVTFEVVPKQVLTGTGALEAKTTIDDRILIADFSDKLGDVLKKMTVRRPKESDKVLTGTGIDTTIPTPLHNEPVVKHFNHPNPSKFRVKLSSAKIEHLRKSPPKRIFGTGLVSQILFDSIDHGLAGSYTFTSDVMHRAFVRVSILDFNYPKNSPSMKTELMHRHIKQSQGLDQKFIIFGGNDCTAIKTYRYDRGYNKTMPEYKRLRLMFEISIYRKQQIYIQYSFHVADSCVPAAIVEDTTALPILPNKLMDAIHKQREMFK